VLRISTLRAIHRGETTRAVGAILEFGMIFRFFIHILDSVYDIIWTDSHLSTEPRFEVATFVRLLIFLPVILFLCCFAWVVIFISIVEIFIRLCISLVKETASLIVSGRSLIRMLWLNSASGRILRNQSIEGHALWDRWLDGI
jgi:hypothetical protein